MRHPSPPLTLEARLPVAWPASLATAVKMPGLGPAPVCRCDELRPRVAAYYTQLQALPRRVRRALHRQLGLPLATLALWLALGQLPALAATIVVGGPCTLVDAIVAANTDAATGGCPAGRGADTIVLPPGSTQTLTSVHNDTYGPTGLPVIRSVITIAGQGSTIVRASEAPAFRLLAVHRTGDLTLQEATVSGGIALGSNSYDDPAGRGGGIWNEGTLTVTHSTLAGNSAYGGARGQGGGVWNDGTCTVTNSTVADNYASRGGGIWNEGTLTVTHSTITGNEATFAGGGVSNGGTLTVTHSTISDNDSGNGGGMSNGGTLTVTHSTIAGNYGSFYGGGVNNGGPFIVMHSTISGNSAFGGGGVMNFGTLTATHSTITGNSTYEDGGGVGNLGTLTVLNSTISGNSAEDGGGGGVGNSFVFGCGEGCIGTVTHSTIAGNSGGGVKNAGTLTVTNSTIAGNSGGGVENFDGTLTVTHSTITGNSAGDFGSGGGVVNYSGTSYSGTLILDRTLVTGNTAPSGSEIFNFDGGTVIADKHNLFGVDGHAGVEGFSPGATDMVPPTGVRLPDILNPTLALHGGQTETHALVPGSPAIDAAGPVCLDAHGDPLTTDQRGQPRPVDGDGDGTAACDIGAFEFFPLANDLVTLDPALDTGFDPTPVPGGPAGTFTITTTFTHTSNTPLRLPFFEVTALSGGNLLLNADEGPAGVGATRTPEVGDDILSPGETVTVDFVIGLQARAPFTFMVELFGEPLR